MKNVNLFLVTAVTMVFLNVGISSCRGNMQQNRNSENDWLIGTWEEIDYGMSPAEIEFKSDGTFTVQFLRSAAEGTYTVSDDKIFLNGKSFDVDSESDYHEILTIVNNSLEGYTKNGNQTIDSDSDSSPQNNESSNAWIVGEWAPEEEDYAEGEIITFNAEGSFSSGDDCTIKGTYTIKENTVYLNGKTVCPEIDLDNNVFYEEEDYSETITMQGNRLKGYRKL